MTAGGGGAADPRCDVAAPQGPGSRPVSGRRRTAYRLPQERKKTVSCSCRRGFLASLTGSVSQLPFIFARQKPCSGQRAHFGTPFGTHTHAPSSMSACVSSPRLPGFSS